MHASCIKVKDFTGQGIYVGLDVHFKSWSVSIYSQELELKTFTQPADIGLLVRHLNSNYPNANLEVAYEAGFCGFWIQRSLSAMGIDCKVVNAADVPCSHKETKRKSDQVDSRKIAKALRSGMLSGIYIPDKSQEDNRQLVRTRAKQIRDMTRIKNRIKASMKLQGIVVPERYGSGRWTLSFIRWLKQIPLSAAARIMLDVYIEELIYLQSQEKKLLEHIKTIGQQFYATELRLLTTIPGIGTIAAMTLLTELGDIKRFRKLEHLNSYCGLTPNTHSSGGTERVTGISRMGNGIVKTILIECAWMAIRKDPALLLYYKQCIVRMAANKAIIKVCRKLLNRIRYVLLNKKEYVTGVME